MEDKTIYTQKGTVRIVKKKGSIDYIIDLEDLKMDINIQSSALMREWNRAYLPYLYRNIAGTRFIIANTIVCDISDFTWWPIHRPYQVKELNDVAFQRIIESLAIPKQYERDICDIIGDNDYKNATLETIIDKMNDIPMSTNVAKWRIMRISDAILYQEIWKIIPYLAKFDGITAPSEKYIKYNLKRFYRTNLQYADTPLKEILIARKVVLPIQEPKLLRNFKALCMTCTPQSEKAGKIAEIALGTKLSEDGDILETPEKALSVTSAQCPFPQRMAANREVVMYALSQAMKLSHNQPPLVKSSHNPYEIDTQRLLVARMDHALTHEDGMIISFSAAQKMKAFAQYVEHIKISKNTEVSIEAINANTKFIVENYDNLMHDDMPFVKKGAVGKNLHTNKYIMSKYRGIVTYVKRITVHTAYDILTVQTLRCTKITPGSKLVDRHSNKGTISDIWPDWKMPTARIPGTKDFKTVDLIVTPYLGKRVLPSREMEEIASLHAYKTGKPYVSKDEDTLESIREFGTNRTLLHNINPNNEEALIAFDIPIGFVSYAVLNHIPADKLKFSNELKTNWHGRTTRGRGNFNWTDGMFVMRQENCESLITEIQDYSSQSKNPYILTQNTKAIGFTVHPDGLKPTEDGIFQKTRNYDVPLISAGVKKTDENASILDTIFDTKFEGTDIYIKLPKGVPLYIKELMESLGSKTKLHKKAFGYLSSKKGIRALKKWGIKKDQVYNNGKNDTYLFIPGHFMHTYVDPITEETHPNNMMTKLNDLILLLNNTAKVAKWNIANNALFGEQIMRANIHFNEVIDEIAKDTIKKSGILREILSPRIPFSGYAVASNSGESSEIVRVPISMLMSFAQKEEFRESYGLPKNPKPQDVYRVFEDNDIRALIQRMPGHERNELSSFVARPWNNHTIGINGATMSNKRGDFDGDTLFIMFPIGEPAKKDLDKLRVELILDRIEPGKAIKDLTVEEVLKNGIKAIDVAYNLSKGDTEFIEDTEYLDKYNQYGNNLIEDYGEQQATAADEFLYIKRGTANAGGIGNSLRHIMYHYFGTKGIEVANRIYHGLAQSALDCKSNSENRLLLDKVFKLLRSPKIPIYKELIEALKVFIDDECVDHLKKVLYIDNKWQGGISVISSNVTPFSKLMHNGGISFMYRSAVHKEEDSMATYLFKL